MSEDRLPELKRIELKEFWRQFRNKGCAGFVIPGHEPSTFHLAPIDDGWLSAMGTAVALTLRSSRPLLAKIYFDKEVKPEDIMVESLGRATETFDVAHAETFVSTVYRYSDTVQFRTLRVRGQESIETFAKIEHRRAGETVTGSEHTHEVKLKIYRMVPFLVPALIDDTDGGRYIPTFFSLSGITVLTSAVFFASRFKRLRLLSAALKNERDGSALFRRIERQIYGVLLAMGLYYAAIEEHRDFYFKFTQEDWLQVRLDADTYGVHDNVFGTVEYKTNQEFMNEHRDRLDKWLKEAVEWWCPHEPEVQGTEVDEKRSILRECLYKTRDALVDIFAETPSQSRSLSRSRSPSALSRFSPLSRRF